MRPLLATCLVLLLVGWALLGPPHRGGEDVPTLPAESLDDSRPASQPRAARLQGRREESARPPRPGETAMTAGEASIWGADIEFRVVDKVTQEPIEGALVRASVSSPEYLESHADGLTREATTNAEGMARLPRLEWNVEYAIRRAGYRVCWIDREDPTMPIELERSAPFRGRVVDTAGAPLPGTRVYAGRGATKRYERVDLLQFTDAKGCFTIAGVGRPKATRLYISHEGYGCIHLDCEGDPEQEHVITLGEGATVSGRVVNPEGSGVSGAEVFLGGRDAHGLLRLEAWELERHAHIIMRTATDARGWFEFRGVSAPSERVVCARTRDGREGETARFALPDSNAQRELLIPVEDVGSVSVSFVEADTGRAISVMHILCALDGPCREAEDRHETREDRRVGLARLSGIKPGKHRLYAEPVGYAAIGHLIPPPVQIEVRAGEETHVEIAFERGRTVKGRVVDEDGHSRHAMVWFASTWKGVEQLTSTQSHGNFELTAVPPGKGRLTLIDLDNRAERVWEDIEIEEVLGCLVLKRGPTLMGRLPPGTDLEEIWMHVDWGDGPVYDGALPVEDDDVFRIRCLRANTAATVCIVAAGRTAFVLRNVVMGPGETRDLGQITFPAGVVLEGRVLDSMGEPVVGAVVRGSEPYARGRATTDGKGRFRLSRLPCLPTTFEVWADKRPLGYFLIDVRAGLSVVTLRLPKPGHLRARFRLLSNEPLPATRVWFVPQPQKDETEQKRRVEFLTDGHGLVEIDLPPGTWVPHLFRGRGDKISDAPPHIVIRSGQTTEVEIRVR